MNNDLYTSFCDTLKRVYEDESLDQYELYKEIAGDILKEYCNIYEVSKLTSFSIDPQYVYIKRHNYVLEDDIDESEYEIILEEGYDQEAIKYINDVLAFGCKSGVCRSLWSFHQTGSFFDKHADAIFEIFDDMIKEFPSFIENFEVNKNNLTWLAYEHVLRNFMYDINPNW